MFNPRERTWHITFNACLFVVLLSGIASAAPSITLSKKSGPPTSRILVSGRGFEANVGVDIYFGTKDEALVVTNGKGEFDKAKIQAPRSARPGEHWVTALERNNDKGAQEPFLVQTDWPMFRCGPDHEGANSFENLLKPENVDQLGIRWMSFIGWSGSSPAVYKGVAYGASDDGIFYAVNAATGTPVWTYSVGAPLSSSPAVVGATVYFASNDGYQSYVYALNATTGALQWKFSFYGGSSSPVVDDGALYVGSNDGSMYALDARKGTLNWRYPTSAILDSSPAVVNGVVYFGSEDSNLYALDAKTGVLLWKYTTGGQVDSSPAVVNGVVYFGVDYPDNSVYALSADTGVLLWKYATGASVYSPPAVANGVVYVGSNDSNLYALNAGDGALLWKHAYPTGYDLPYGPTIANGVVYVSVQTGDFLIGNLEALDAKTGTRLWQYSTGDSLFSSPAVANGLLYTTSYKEGDQGDLYAFGLGRK